MKRGNLWTLRMEGTETSGTFGSLKACMQVAYNLTDAHFSDDLANWEADCNAEIA